jgi:hypothetical protein
MYGTPALRVALTALPLAAALVGAAAAEAPEPNAQTVIVPLPPETCAILDDPQAVARMDGLLFNLIWSCDRTDLLGRVEPEFLAGGVTEGAENFEDAQVNQLGETGSSTTQSETSIVENEDNGTLCSGYNDSCEFFCPGGGGGFTGFSRSIDGGATWEDRGTVGANTFGDPSLIWRRIDGKFYIATLGAGGNLRMNRSDDDCVTFTEISIPASGNDDKEIVAVDNNPLSPNYGNIYLLWTDFGAGGNIVAKRSVDGGVLWSNQATVGTGIVQGAWPFVAPNGDVYVAWLLLSSFPNGNVTIKVARSTDAGLSYVAVTDVVTAVTGPRNQAATAFCGRDALNGNIRYLASPQLSITDDGTLHVVYSYDPDGFNVGDVVDVFYKRSINNGTTWSTEMRLSTDATTTDQYFPAIHTDGTKLITGWYSRENDTANNLLQDYYIRTSPDGGATWNDPVRVSDVSSPIHIDPNLATCYHGDYDQVLMSAMGSPVAQWADDRNLVDTSPLGERNDPDVFSDGTSGGAIFQDGFESGDTSRWDQTAQ